jgi:hypothetical protein
MIKFYTHVVMNDLLAADDEGQEFADLDAAKEAADLSARNIALEALGAGKEAVRLELHIHDDAGARLATLSASATYHRQWLPPAPQH